MSFLHRRDFKVGFDRLREQNRVTKKDLKRLFARDVADQWPLQRRVSDYEFLKPLPPDEREKEIMLYAVQCWSDVRKCAIESKYSQSYVCCITFASDDADVLWPELYFFNHAFGPLSKLQLSDPKSDFGTRIAQLVSELRLPEDAVVLEEHCKAPDYEKIYLDFKSTV